MEINESVKSINIQLIDLFGLDTITGQQIFRVVWSDNQFEKRLGEYEDFTPSGIYLRTVKEVREVPKYKQWVHQKYVLEQLVIIPEMNQDELPVSKTSYEPLYVFQTNSGEYLPPKIEAAKFIIDTVLAAKGRGSLAKYKDPDDDQEEAIHNQIERVNELEEEIFGNETNITDSLRNRTGIVVPGKFEEN